MKLLLDECVDRRLSRVLLGHEVKTVPQMGWAGTKNGALLKLAEPEFEVFITVDRNLSFQQNLTNLGIAVIVLHANSNSLDDLQPLMAKALVLLPTLSPGQVVHIR